MDGTAAHVEVPTPEQEVWQLAAADLGSNAAMLAIGIAVLWRFVQKLFNKMLAAATKQAEDADARAKQAAAAADARNERLAGAQAHAIGALTTAVAKVEIAVVRSDEHNTAAIAGLRSHLERHETRLDRVDARLEVHGERIGTLEHGSPVRRLARTGGDKD